MLATRGESTTTIVQAMRTSFAFPLDLLHALGGRNVSLIQSNAAVRVAVETVSRTLFESCAYRSNLQT